ncbi:MAG: hypothetical protein GY765_00260, partial [bacterium]|nr:hypothetical protein [bacterium]
MKNKSLHIILLTLLIIPLSVFSLTISVRSFDHQNYTRLVFEGDRGFEFDFKESDKGFNINLKEEATFVKKGASFKNSAIVNNVVHNVKGQSSNFDVQLASKFKVKRNFVLERPFRVVFDLVKSTEKKADSKPLPLPSGRQQGQEVLGNENSPPPADAAPQEEEPEDEPEARVAPRQARKRGAIETICIDAGHGGSDLGAVGAQKTLEKDITLK